MPEPTPLSQRRVALVDVLDQALDTGVVAMGDLTISLAGVDLVYAGVRLLLCSADTAQAAGVATPLPSSLPLPPPTSPSPPSMLSSTTRISAQPTTEPTNTRPVQITNPATAEIDRGLAQLVLTIVELLRQTLERQSLRRMEAGSLDDQQIERLGQALMQLETRMDDLKKLFGLNESDLNLDLGPLGQLL
ncbi:MAG: hypothetical protein OHK0050_28250 [Roseiflexaceae bacterium]